MTEEIKKLLAQGRKLEAVRLVHKQLDCTLQEAKAWVDAVEQGGNPETPQSHHRGWNIAYLNGEPAKITITDDRGTHEAAKGSDEWNAVIAQSRQEGHGRIEPKKPGMWSKLWQGSEQKPGLLKRFSNFVLFTLLALFCFLILYVLFYMEDLCEGYAGMAFYTGHTLIMWAWSVFCCRHARNRQNKWYMRLLTAICSIAVGCWALASTGSLVTDLTMNRLNTYEGPFTMGREYNTRSWRFFYITWDGDTNGSMVNHYISTDHYRLLEIYSTARITYWENTGIVKSIEPRTAKSEKAQKGSPLLQVRTPRK
ncbi:MAG TPA: hypothetical protein VIQ97_01230 [Prevotella sp.]